MKLFRAVVLSCALSLGTSALYSQVNMPAPSPSSQIQQTVGLTDITISYSRPSAKGRTIFGDLVPFGKVWRTGANSATIIEFKDPVSFNGVNVPAGKYSLLSIPEKNSWTVILNSNTELWGTGTYKQSEDVARFPVKVTNLPQSVETFTISVGNLGMNSAEITISWDKTAVSFNVQTEVDSKVMADIKKNVIENSSPKPSDLAAAARYYMETSRDLNSALSWINKSIEAEPKFWIIYQKARIQQKMSDFKGAIATAKLSKAEAEKAGNADYVKLNEKLIAECEKGK